MKWMIEDGIFQLMIKENNTVKTPVAVIATALNWKKVPAWRKRAETNAALIATAPELLAACEEVFSRVEEDRDPGLYSMLKSVIRKAKHVDNEVGYE